MYIYPWGTHISWSMPNALLSFYPQFSGALSPEDLILYWKSHNFYHLSPKDPLFCVKTLIKCISTPGHSHIMVYAKCTPFIWRLFSGALSPEDLILYSYWKSRNFNYGNQMLDTRTDHILSFLPIFAWSKKLPNFAVKHVDLSWVFGMTFHAWVDALSRTDVKNVGGHDTSPSSLYRQIMVTRSKVHSLSAVTGNALVA